MNGQAMYIARLGDLNLGNPKGIPSSLRNATNEEVWQYFHDMLKAVVRVTDRHHFTCIDGRKCVCNADRSSSQIRRAQVSGTGAMLEQAWNADAPLVDELRVDEHDVYALAQAIENAIGVVKRSAHLGRCGGVAGAVADNHAIGEKPAILDAVRAMMELEPVRSFTSVRFDAKAAAAVRRRAPRTANRLERLGWDHDMFIKHVVEESPSGVEDLKTFDNGFGGHEEPAIVFVLSRGRDKTVSQDTAQKLGLGRPFVSNLDASYDVAIQLGMGEDAAVRRALIANLAKHVAVADRLASPETPVGLLVA